MSEKKYERVGDYDMAFSLTGVQQALGVLEYARPTLYVHPDWVGAACQISRHLDVNVEVDLDNQTTEWYVEWQGKRVGSVGC